MGILERLADGGHELVACGHDRATGLRAIVAVHSTVLGPSLGGTRFAAYDDGDAALEDVLRLSAAMTYKMAVAGLDLGGGKAVIVGDPRTTRSDDLVLAYGRFIDSLGGRYLTAEDVGTTTADMDLIRTVTPHVTGTSRRLGGSGDPSPATALGLTHAIEGVARHLWGSDDLSGRHVVVLGVGKVGGALVGHLVAAGVKVTVADVDDRRVRWAEAEHGTAAVEVADALTTTCDVLAPCALGGVLTAATIGGLRCAAVCGAANNQLGTHDDAERLADAGVLFAPDFVVNAGGVLNIAEERTPGGYDEVRARARIATVGSTLGDVLAEADSEGITPLAAAERRAERRLAAAGRP